MSVSMFIPSGEILDRPITTTDLMLTFAHGWYLKLEKNPGSNNFLMGKIVKIECESGYPDGQIPTAFNVTINCGPKDYTMFVRTLAK